MNLDENLQIKDLALWLKKQKTLIIADLHLGYENCMQKSGYMLPWFQYAEIKAKLQKIIPANVEKIIINGDLKHEFGQIPQQEWDEVKGMIDFLRTYTEDLILIKGNHDSILSPIARHKKVELEPKGLLIDSYFITHGHKLFEIPKEAKTIIIGHEHPAVSISDGISRELCKCFLKGTYNKKTLIVQPSLCTASEGSDILSEKTLSPYLKNISNFDVFVAADKTRHFGKVSGLRET
ncbi:MAG: metallophosphoesterase [archaeon]